MGSVGLLAGCVESNGNGQDQGGQEETCRMVERTRKVGEKDELETVTAGSTWITRVEAEEDDRLIISARLIDDGARPALTVENPLGATVADVGPSEHIEREITAREEGRYYIRFENEALLTSGQWDLDIVWERDYEQEVCD